MKKDSIAIIILNYNSWKETLNEAELCHKLLQIEYQNIIVIDNASTNDSAKNLETESKKRNFVFIKSDVNRGYGAGNNIGLRYAFAKGYKYAFILNNDIIIKDACLISKLLDIFKENSNIAVVNPDVYSVDGHLFNRDAIRPSFFDYTIGLINYKKKGRKIQEKNGYGIVYRPQGCCMLVDINKMNEVDYFDENTFLYWEEPILAERLLNKGYLCACDLKTSIIHNHSKTVRSTFDIRRIIKINNESFAYYLKYYRNYSTVFVKICCLFNTIKLKKLNA